jgi:hypothetical protein
MRCGRRSAHRRARWPPGRGAEILLQPDNSMTTSPVEAIQCWQLGAMRVTRRKRQIFLFLAAILVPAGVLIGLAGGIMCQDRELAAKRAVNQRRSRRRITP